VTTAEGEDTQLADAPVASTAPTVAHPRRYLAFAIVSIALFMASVDQTVVATALPELQADLDTSLAWAAWTIAVAGLGRALMMPTSGALADRYGHRRIFLTAVVVFTVASLGCALAGNIWVLITLRAMQAFGAGAFAPSAMAIVARYFGTERDRAIGMLTSIMPIGALVGPVLGGLCIELWSWRGIFLLNLPVGILLIGLGRYYLAPGSAQPSTKPLDLAGLGLFGAAVLSAMLGISVLSGADRVSAALSVVFLVSSVGAFLAYRAHAKGNPNVFIALEFMWGRGFRVTGLLNFLFGAGAVGLASLVPIYARERYGIGPAASGLLLTARAVGVLLVASAAAMALRRTGYRWPMYIGFVVTAAGLAGLASPPLIGHPITWLAVTTALTGVGFGLVTPAANNATMQLAPDHVASIAGIRGMFRQTGSIAAVSVTATAVAMSSHPATTHAATFAGFAVLMVLALPAIARVPDHRGSW
jgi:EmrB/QacA subfamily drug resistance transporter